jgi:SAM-dependent methyltransferase
MEEPMTITENPWDTHAAAYAEWVARREQGLVASVGMDATLSILLDLLGDLDGKTVLDAGCGQGFLARILAARGARVVGIDLSPRLIALAREQDPAGTITYRVADLSRPLPDLAGQFDRIGSYLALNDVADHRGFATTLAALTGPGGRSVIALNNPYSAPVRGHLTDYFADGTRATYGGMSAALGGEIGYYHRTLGEHLDAFLVAGWRLAKLVDVPAAPRDDLSLPPHSRFPLFMVLAFDKPE